MKLAAIASVALTLAAAKSAEAFTPKGHVTIEAKAYQRLLVATDIDDGQGHKVRGVDVLETLIRRGFLEHPRCFEPETEHEKKDCDAARKSAPARFWPVLGAGAPDMMSSRQFSTNGQCFHFMSSAAPVWKTKRDPWLKVPTGMIDDAYMRCTRALGDLFARMIHEPALANRNYRGLYAILHMITDSYSRAHVERDANGDILFLKPWQLRAFAPYLLPGRWQGFDFLWSDTHHAISDERDERYMIEDKTCHEEAAPYEIEERCLSPEGRAAVLAVEDMLLTVYRIERAEEAKAPPEVEAALRGFIGRRLHSARANPDLRPPFEDDREWSPAYELGFRYRPRPRPGADHDLTVAAGATLFSDVTLPFVPFVSLEAGCRYVAGRCVFTMGGDALSLLVPLSEGLVVGFTPLSLSGDADEGFQHLRVAMNVARADLYLLDSLWLSVSGPSYSWIHQSFDGEPFSLGFGVSWDGRSTPFRHGGPAQGLGDARFVFDSRKLEASRGAPIEDWSPPPLDHDFRKSRVTTVVHVAGASLLHDGGAGTYSLGGFEELWDRNREGRRGGLALGVRADSEYRPTSDEKNVDAVGGPVARVYVVRDAIAIEAEPLLLDAGVRVPEGENARAAADLEAAASLALMPISRTEISVDSPRLSYVHGKRVDGTNVGVRLGFFFQ